MGNGEFCLPIFTPPGSATPAFTVRFPIDCQYLDTGRDRHPYSRVERQAGGRWVAGREWSRHGLDFAVRDAWSQGGAGRVNLQRRVTVSARVGQDRSGPAQGLQLQLALGLNPTGAATWRFFAPAMIYAPSQYHRQGLHAFSDHRLAYPLVGAYEATSGMALSLIRVGLPGLDDRPQRPRPERRYLHHTDIGSIGFSNRPATAALHLFWPYHEGDRSAMLDAQGTPASAFFPIGRTPLDVTLRYEVGFLRAESFADTVLSVFKRAWAIARPTPPRPPFPLARSIELRLASVTKTYREWATGVRDSS